MGRDQTAGPWQRHPRLSLLAKYGLTSLALFVALGSVLGNLLQQSMEARVMDSTVRQAEVIALLGIQRTIVPEEVAGQLTPDRVQSLEHALTVSLSPLDVVEVTIWNLDGTVVYASDQSTIGQRTANSRPLRAALGGQARAVINDVTTLEDPIVRRHGQVLEAYLPLRFGHGPLVPHEGVVRTTIPYAPIAETIRHDTLRLYLGLGLALAVLYGVLFRLVARASGDLRKQAATNEYQAMHDELTDLPNRSLFHDRLHQAVAESERSGERMAVMLMDLDGFKEVNDTLGHHNGDLLLQMVAGRLAETLRNSDTVARLGGDEFAVLLRRVNDESSAVNVARKVHAALADPFDVQDLELEIGASIGIAMYPDHGDRPESLLQRADVAMYAAKREQRGQALYEPDEDDHSTHRLVLATELRRAVQQGELVLHYQAKHDLATGVVIGAEALVRWDHPVHGMLSPDLFIPVAERTGLIHALTEKVLDTALADCSRWRDRGHPVGVAVNLSVRNLHDDHLVPTVQRLLDTHGVPAWMLTLEITETMIAADPEIAHRAVVDLRTLGVRLAIDDFGTGYASLAVLRRMPVHELKIDRSFVGDLCHSPDAAAIVSFSSELGHRLGLTVVAEGVEDARAANELATMGCDVAQGYGYSMPIPFDELVTYLERQLAAALLATSAVDEPRVPAHA